MASILAFILFCGALVLVALMVARRTGARTWFIEQWEFAPDEAVLWQDDRADVVIVPRLGQSASMRPLRLHRWKVAATARQVILANKAIGGRGVVRYVLVRGEAPPGQGGLLTKGYATMRILPGARHDTGYVALRPDPSAPAALNISEFRIYSDQIAAFPG